MEHSQINIGTSKTIFENTREIATRMSSKMNHIWEEGERKWSLYKMKSSRKHFVPIPRDHEFDEHIHEQCSVPSNDANPQSSIQHNSFIQNIFRVDTEPLPGQALHKSSMASHAHYSKNHLLSTKQLLGLTFFAISGGPFGLQGPIAFGGPMLMLIGFCFIPFMWSIPLTLMTTEMACMIPESGGHVLWVYRAFGPFWSYVNGFFAFACSVLDNALYPSLFVEYLSALLLNTSTESQPLNYGWSVFIKMLVLIIATIINILGIDIVGNISIVLAFMVFAPFIIMCFAGLNYINYSWMGKPISEQVNRGQFLAILLWNTSGIDIIGTCASEVLTPSHSYPQVMKYSILFLIGLFSLPPLIGVSIVPNQQNWNIGTYFYVAKTVGGNFLEGWMGFAAIFSALGLLITRLCANSRILYGMAQVEQMPSKFTLLHPKFATPWVAILTSSLCTLIFNFFNIYYLAEVDMLFYALSTLLKFGALVQLRFTEPDVLRPFQIPFEKELLAVITCLPLSMCIAMLFYASEQSHGIALIGASAAVLSYIIKELFAHGMKEATKKRLAKVQENLVKMQKRIDVVINNELKVLQNIGLYMRSHGNSTNVALTPTITSRS